MILKANSIIKSAKYLVAFTGAGISVESGIPPFRGENGIWNKYDPEVLDINEFHRKPKYSWEIIKEMFFDFIGKIEPNLAHYSLAKLEKDGVLQTIITQNIDNLHYKAGNRNLIEFHGNMRDLICLKCSEKQRVADTNLDVLPPTCSTCGGILKPDFIFFGEQIPQDAYKKSIEAISKADVMLIIGTTGVIYPASNLPHYAKQKGAKIIEINIEKSAYSDTITDVFLQGKATEIMSKLVD